MKSSLRILYNHFEECILFSMITILVLSINIEVFRRYVLHHSGAYSEEFARYLMIAIIYLGLPYAMRFRRHITVDVLPANMSEFVHLVVNLVSYILTLILAGFMVVGTLELVDQQMMLDNRSQAMAAPMWWFTSLIGLGYFLLALRVVEIVIQDIRAYKKDGHALHPQP